MGFGGYQPSGPLTSFSQTGGQSPSKSYGFAPPPTGGGGPAGGANVLASFQTKGYGTMPTGASGRSQALKSMASNINWNDMRYGGGTRRGEEMGTMSDQANLQYQQAQESWEGEQRDQQRQMFAFKNKMMQKLLELFGGQGAGGNLNVGMPIEMDPRIKAGLQADVSEQFRPQEIARQKMKAKGGRTAFDATAVAQGDAALAGSKASAMTQSYVPGMQASVNAYQPGLEAAKINKQGQITPQLIMQALMQGGFG